MQCEIITIGDEILIGQIVDTNSSWLGRTLNAEGIDIHQVRSIRDEQEDIHRALNELNKDTELVVLTGGLGPTRDDKTKESLASYFGVQLVHHPDVEAHIEALFARFNRDVNKLNRSQAWLPENCTPLFNEKGTAPGMLFYKRNRWYVSLPGVPYEMKHLIEDKLLPLLKEKVTINNVLVHRTLLTQGVPESILAEKLEAFEDALPTYLSLAYLPSPGRVRLRITGRGPKNAGIEDALNTNFEVLKRSLEAIVYGEGDEEMEEIVGKTLRNIGKTVGIAESCTGGYISHLLTRVPGSSEYYKGSLLTYSNALKQSILHVSAEDLETYGAVSKQVVEQMASKAAEILSTDFALSTSGIAGPGGGSSEKPVGLVWIGLAGPNGVKSAQFQFNGDRERIIRKTALTALDMLRRELEMVPHI